MYYVFIVFGVFFAIVGFIRLDDFIRNRLAKRFENRLKKRRNQKKESLF